jgi:hypothetical protein
MSEIRPARSFYDLIFPLFIFVTGVAIVFSLMPQSLPFRVLELPTDDVTCCARNHALAGQHFGERLGGPIRADNP